MLIVDAGAHADARESAWGHFEGLIYRTRDDRAFGWLWFVCTLSLRVRLDRSSLRVIVARLKSVGFLVVG